MPVWEGEKGGTSTAAAAAWGRPPRRRRRMPVTGGSCVQARRGRRAPPFEWEMGGGLGQMADLLSAVVAAAAWSRRPPAMGGAARRLNTSATNEEDVSSGAPRHPVATTPLSNSWFTGAAEDSPPRRGWRVPWRRVGRRRTVAVAGGAPTCARRHSAPRSLSGGAAMLLDTNACTPEQTWSWTRVMVL